MYVCPQLLALGVTSRLGIPWLSRAPLRQWSIIKLILLSVYPIPQLFFRLHSGQLVVKVDLEHDLLGVLGAPLLRHDVYAAVVAVHGQLQLLAGAAGDHVAAFGVDAGATARGRGGVRFHCLYVADVGLSVYLDFQGAVVLVQFKCWNMVCNISSDLINRIVYVAS